MLNDMSQELSDFILVSKYAQHNERLKRRETWGEAVARVQRMHLKKYPHLAPEYQERLSWAFGKVLQMEDLPSMRSLQFGGKAIEAKNARMFNCSVRHIDSLRSFAESFWLLLCGCGVGFGLNEDFLGRLPNLVDASDKTGTVINYVIEDTIEGWADSLEALLMCYFKNTPHTGRKIVFDYSRIRKKGSKLKTGGGKAPGYSGLKATHQKIKALLDYIIEELAVTRLRSVDAYDILMHSADAVLSGGIRRSACSVCFWKTDQDMMTAKTNFTIVKYKQLEHSDNAWHVKVFYKGKWKDISFPTNPVITPNPKDDWNYKQLVETNQVSWLYLEPQRARSNNTVLLLRSSTSLEEFQQIVELTKQWGEPGFAWVNHKWTLYNPCFTVDQKILTDAGWRSFGELLNQTPTIVQDNRVLGRVENSKEVWDFDLSATGTCQNKSPRVAMTGENQIIYRLRTTCGREIKGTGNHLIATASGMKELADLEPGEEILVALPHTATTARNSSYWSGFISGLWTGDGTTGDGAKILDVWTNNPQEIRDLEEILRSLGIERTFNKVLEEEDYSKYRLQSKELNQVIDANIKKNNLAALHHKSADYKAGFVAGMLYSDGHIEYHPKNGDISVRITQSNLEVLQDLSLVLQELGVFAKIYDLLEEGYRSLPDGHGGNKDFFCKKSYRLAVTGVRNARNFVSAIKPFGPKGKLLEECLKSFGPGKKINCTTKVQSVEKIGVENVYCLQEDNRRTLVAGGIVARRCFEIGFIPVLPTGETGVQFCNLSTQNGGRIRTLQEFLDCAEAATIIGTCQAGFTRFDYLGPVSKRLTEEEALLGVSITGIMDHPEIVLNPEYQQIVARHVVAINKKWAEALGINQAARTTCVKPEGTSSPLIKTRSGIGPAHARRYFRRVQCNKLEGPYNLLKSKNPHACEESVWSAGKTDDVVTFCITAPETAITRDQLSAIKHLEYIRSTQCNWVRPGTTDVNNKDVEHNVSCTVNIKPNEWDEAVQFIYDNRRDFTAVSLLPFSGDKDYPQAPFESVVTEEDEKRWSNLCSQWQPVNYQELIEDEDETQLNNTVACAGGKCEI